MDKHKLLLSEMVKQLSVPRYLKYIVAVTAAFEHKSTERGLKFIKGQRELRETVKLHRVNRFKGTTARLDSGAF